MTSTRIQTAACVLVCFLLVAGLQYWSGASEAAFNGYPDEPSHYLGGLMVRDYLDSGLPAAPRAFATNYYLHLPFLAIGYWPPLFYLEEGVWMEAVGYSRTKALLFLALISALISATIFAVTRSTIGIAGAFLCAVLFMLLPDVLLNNSMVMTDTSIALFSFWSVLVLARYFETGSYRYAILFGVLASCTIMTKYSGAFLGLLPPLGLLIGRRWDLLRRGSFWIQPVVVAVLCGPWVFYTRQYAAVGFASFQKAEFWSELLQYLYLWRVDLGIWLSLLLFGAWLYQTIFLAKASALIQLLWLQPLAVLLFQSLAPVGIETRYLIPALAPLIVLLAFALAKLPKAFGPAVLAVAVAGYSLVALPYFRRPANPVRTVVEAAMYKTSQLKQSLVYVPADVEGPMIAEFAMRDAKRPMRVLARTNKILASMDWGGGTYKSNYQQPGELEKFFEQNAPDLVILHVRSAGDQFQHERLLTKTIAAYPACWKLLEGTAGYSIYEFECQSDTRGTITEPFRSRLLDRF
jgi:hypothetical protein